MRYFSTHIDVCEQIEIELVDLTDWFTRNCGSSVGVLLSHARIVQSRSLFLLHLLCHCSTAEVLKRLRDAELMIL